EPADHAIAKRKILRDRRCRKWKLGNKRALFSYLCRKLSILFWINGVEPGAHHCNGQAPAFERTAMRSRINAAGEPGHNRHSALRKLSRKLFSNVAPVGRTPPR